MTAGWLMVDLGEEGSDNFQLCPWEGRRRGRRVCAMEKKSGLCNVTHGRV